jgi:hypothetical protein
MQPSAIDSQSMANYAAVAAANVKTVSERLEASKPERDESNPFCTGNLAEQTRLYRSNPQEARRLAQKAGVTLPE